MQPSLGELSLELYPPSSSLSSPVQAVLRQDPAQRDPEQLLASPLLWRCSGWPGSPNLLLTTTAGFPARTWAFCHKFNIPFHFVCLFWTRSSLPNPNPQFLPPGSLPISETSMLSLFRTNFSPNAPFPPLMSHLKTPSSFTSEMFLQPTLPVTSTHSPRPVRGFHVGPGAPQQPADCPVCCSSGTHSRLGTEITLNFLSWHQINNLHPVLNPCSLNKYQHSWRNCGVGSQMVLFKNNLWLTITNVLATWWKVLLDGLKNKLPVGLPSLTIPLGVRIRFIHGKSQVMVTKLKHL